MAFDLTSGVRIDVTQPETPRFVVTPPTPSRVVMVPVRGPAGPAGESNLDAHIADPVPHAAAMSGRDFAGWYRAATR